MNYYDLIKVTPSASQVEITAAINQLDDTCNKYIQQVSDPVKIEQIRALLSKLETVHSILLNPTLREKYDQSIGIKSTNPTIAQPPSAVQPDLTQNIRHSADPNPQQTTGTHYSGSNQWLCTRCQTQNPEGCRHCQKCGNVIGKDCPHCGATILASAMFCGRCGTDIAAFEREKAKQIKIQENLANITALQEKIALGKEEIEDWEDVLAGSVPPDIDIRSSSPCFRKYRRFEASVKPPNLIGLWLFISVLIGIFVGVVVRIPADIALYIGLFFSLPVALIVLRCGGGCAGSVATLCVAGTIGAAIVAWGGPILIGIFAGLISIPIVIFSGNAIMEKRSRNAIQVMAYGEIEQTKRKVQDYQAELNRLSEG